MYITNDLKKNGAEQVWSVAKPTTSVAKPTTSVALGFFDGLHLGHQAVIRRAVECCDVGCSPAVFTFTLPGMERPEEKRPDLPNSATGKKEGLSAKRPASKPDSAFRLITDRERETLLSGWGVEWMVCPPFSAIQSMEPEEFVQKVLADRMHAGTVCCGRDFRFGKRAGAGAKELRTICAALGILVELVDEVTWDGRRISSTWIRDLIHQGDVKTAASLLGRPFGYDFTVISGKRLGRTLHFPTINQSFSTDFITPRHGVYASVAFAEGKWRPAVTNVGLRPTVEVGGQVNSETYIMEFDGDLYDSAVPVRLLEFLRPEVNLGSLDALRAQIGRDTEAARVVAEAFLDRNHEIIGK